MSHFPVGGAVASVGGGGEGGDVGLVLLTKGVSHGVILTTL